MLRSLSVFTLTRHFFTYFSNLFFQHTRKFCTIDLSAGALRETLTRYHTKTWNALTIFVVWLKRPSHVGRFETTHDIGARNIIIFYQRRKNLEWRRFWRASTVKAQGVFIKPEPPPNALWTVEDFTNNSSLDITCSRRPRIFSRIPDPFSNIWVDKIATRFLNIILISISFWSGTFKLAIYNNGWAAEVFLLSERLGRKSCVHSRTVTTGNLDSLHGSLRNILTSGDVSSRPPNPDDFQF